MTTANNTAFAVGSESCNGLKSVAFERTVGVVVTAIGTAVFNLAFGFFAIVSNSLVMIVVYRQGSSRAPADLFIASMSLTDFFVGLIVQPFSLILRLHELADVHLCNLKTFYAFFGYLCSGASMLTLCSFSLDRVFALALPYRYNREVIYNKYVIGIATYWLIWLVYTLLPFTGVISSKKYYLSLSCVIVITVLTAVACYFYIMAIVRRHRRKIVSLAPSEQHAGDTSRTQRRSLWIKSQQKKSFTAIIIVCVFVVCYFPKVCTMVAVVLVGNDLDVLYIAGKWTDTFIFINSSVNPIIYVVRIREMRNDMIAIWRKLRPYVTMSRCRNVAR